MQVKLENLEGLERKLSFALPWSTINAEVTLRLQKAQRKAKVQGFRPGKAPLQMVESMYGAGIRDEVMNESVQKAFYQAIVDQKVRVAGFPRFEAEKEQDDETLFKCFATFETYPEIKVGDFAAKEIEKISTKVTDAEVEKTIDILRKQRTRFNHVERAAKETDRVIIDFKGSIDGDFFEGGSAENSALVLGAGQMLPEFETGIVGMKEGDVKDITVNFPEDYHGKEVAGKTAIFTITMKNVSEAQLPEVDAEFAKALGIPDGDVKKMHEEVQKNIEREVKRRTSEKTKENVLQALLDVTEIQLPQALIQEETVRLMNEMRQNFANQGMDVKNLPQFPADMFKVQAERRVSLGLILAQIVSDNELHAKEEQIKSMIAEFADSYEDPDEVVQWYLEDKERMQGPTALVVESNVVDFVLSKAKTIEKEMSFDEIMGAQAGQNL